MTKEEIIHLLETDYLNGIIDIKAVKEQIGYASYYSSEFVFKDLGIYDEFKKIQNKRRGLSAKKTNLERYGVANGKNKENLEKEKMKCREKYGVDYIWQRKDVIEKANQTKLERYGNEHYTNREKNKNTLKERYNVTNCSQMMNYVEKVKNTKKEKYGDENYNNATQMRKTKLHNIEIYEQEYNCLWLQNAFTEYGTGWYQANIISLLYIKDTAFVKNEDIPKIIDYNNTFSLNKGISHKEKDILSTISTIYNKEILENSRQIIAPQELDIYIPDLQLAIEFNGTRWHSVEQGTPKDYHLHKSLVCREKSIRLVHIYEFEDIEQQKQLLKDLILGYDNYPKEDFNKNNLIDNIPQPEIIYSDKYTIYGAGKLYQQGG